MFLLPALLAGAGTSMVSAQSVESVTSQKERCLRKLEKVERSLETITAGIERVRRLRQASKENSVSSDAFIEKSQSKVEYLNNRIERTRNQLEKIESDLQNAQNGKQCPKCIASDVNLFCRQIESLYTENGDLGSEVNGFERTLRASVSVTDLCKRNDLLLAAIDSLTRSGNCRYQAAVTLQENARSAIASNKLDAAMAFALEAGDSVAAIPSKRQVRCPLDSSIERISKRLTEARKSATGKDTTGKADRILAKAQEHFEKGKAQCIAGKTEEARTELSIAEKFIATAISSAGRAE
jgi:hypothetical protein